eukprot:1231916-Karenia_brevis.AAC.1
MLDGPAAVVEAWHALRAGMRAMGISSKSGLVEWHSNMGYGTLANNAYLQASAQVHLLASLFGALGCTTGGIDSPMES